MFLIRLRVKSKYLILLDFEGDFLFATAGVIQESTGQFSESYGTDVKSSVV